MSKPILADKIIYALESTDKAEKAVVFDVEHIIDWYLDTTNPHEIDLYKDFPCLGPVYPVIVMEASAKKWKHAESILAYGTRICALMVFVDTQEPEKNKKIVDGYYEARGCIDTEVRWILELAIAMGNKDGFIENPTEAGNAFFFQSRLFIGNDGSPLKFRGSLENTHIDIKYSNGYVIGYNENWDDIFKRTIVSYAPFLMALSIMNCKNVEIVDMKPRVHGKRKRHAPKVKYYTLNVYPFKTRKENIQHGNGDGSKKAMHLRRGHWADYRYGPGLFGNPSLTGIYWKGPVLCGNIDEGMVVKDYRIAGGDQ